MINDEQTYEKSMALILYCDDCDFEPYSKCPHKDELNMIEAYYHDLHLISSWEIQCPHRQYLKAIIRRMEAK